MPNRRPLPLKNLISTTPVLATLQQKSALLLALNRVLQTLLPPSLHGHCRVANYRQGILVVETANASWHLRLRYEQARLLSALRHQRLPELVSITVKINPSMLRAGGAVVAASATPAYPARRPISPRSAHKLRLLAMRCSLGLRAMLLKLAALENTTTP